MSQNFGSLINGDMQASGGMFLDDGREIKQKYLTGSINGLDQRFGSTKNTSWLGRRKHYWFFFFYAL